MSLTLIDYGSGNIRSVAKALEAASNKRVRVTATPEDVASASHLILPGQGAFGRCLAGLQAHKGLLEALNQAVIHHRVPYLGICVGMQLMLERGLEDGVFPGFSWIEGEVDRLETKNLSIKIPHMGWNNISLHQNHSVLCGLDGKDFYFCHSYVAHKIRSPIASMSLETDEVAALGRDNMLGVQFHPEKSQAAGIKLLEQFARWMP